MIDNPRTWNYANSNKTEPAVDIFKQYGIEEQDNRKRFTEDLCPGLNGLKTKYLVAPVGSINDPVICITNYHNMTPFSSSGFTSIHDLTSPSLFTMYTKLGQIDAGKGKVGMLHLWFAVKSSAWNPKHLRSATLRSLKTTKRLGK